MKDTGSPDTWVWSDGRRARRSTTCTSNATSGRCPPKTDPGKLFAGLYALYDGIVFLVVAGLLLAPVTHRVLHHFHWTEERGS